MRITLSILFFLSSFALADITCQDLVDSIELAFDRADSVVMEVWLEQSIFEIGYTKLQLYKDVDTWKSEVLEKRGAQHQKKEGGSAEPDIGFDCKASDSKIIILETENGYLLEVIESDKSKKIKHWILKFSSRAGLLLPTEVIAKFEISVLTIPLAGQAVTKLSNWTFP